MQPDHYATTKLWLDKWQFIRNGGIGEIRYEGCKMSSTPSNMTLILYEGQSGSGTYQWIRLINGLLELGIDLERGKKTRASSIITMPLSECYDAIDKLIDHYEKV